ncbi:IPT/TIG domain-containing protein [Flavobacterium hercynium]|uniref:IPT/TIG domain-containing protein n=1 Tax=Flavobacterium hercynium TaxID=387094 RepID=A0A226HGR6_9FLAO|nr:IPT/TIG domain-containing protein [Flavobacterium hercynium]OXA92841.1 hypothetical protein B0A66_08685 [Flavobacterium hercynium]SMP02689.1 IPT/TIG domain-containing protein [Flavobacterium hercynium]
MKSTKFIFAALLFTLVFSSCSSDSDPEPVKEVVVPPTVVPPVTQPVLEAKITAFSKNYGAPGDEVTLTGENFTDKIENIQVTFDSTPAKIVSASATEIKFILPATTYLVPVLNLSITNTKITNTVKNLYNGNIAVLNPVVPGAWTVLASPSDNNGSVNSIQILDNRAMYYHSEKVITFDGTTGSYFYVYRSLDEGKTWKQWTETASPYGLPFHASTNDTGWSLYGVGSIYNLSVGGEERTKLFTNNSFISSIVSNDDLSTGTVVTLNGQVYKSTDGANFTNEYTMSGSNYGVGYPTASVGTDHIWVGGSKGTTLNDGFAMLPFLLYKKSAADGWKELFFSNTERNTVFSDMQFVDANFGFALFEGTNFSTVLRTSNGGDSWTEVDKTHKFRKITFKDELNGFATQGNIIYKTTDGGLSWSVDYTHDEDIINIKCKNNVIWGVSKSKILRRYL